MLRRALPVICAISLLGPQLASACDEGERLRLGEEMSRLATRNAWAGVERSFESLIATKCDVRFDNYFLGAQSARFLGKTYEMYERLDAARALEPKAEILEELSSLDASYGRIEIKGDARKRPVLTRAEMPFSPDERKSVEWAMEVVAGTGSFKGMLPSGDYVVGELPFTVAPGNEWQTLEVGKFKGPKPDAVETDGPAVAGGGTTKQGTFNYAHLVANIGPAFASSGAPKDEVLNGDGRHERQPASFGASGLAIQIGGEVGLTYKAPEAGVALTLGYQHGFGNDTVNMYSVWLAGVLRPGNFRFAGGPTYSVMTAQGIGVADWVKDFNFGKQTNDVPIDTENARYRGYGYGGGAQASVGYGLLDLDPLQGVVEIGGSWQRDDARSYYAIGLRIGLVPKVPRFKG